MLAGKIYDPNDAELLKLRQSAHRLCKQYNDTFEEEADARKNILDGLLQGPVYFDYGVFTHVGKGFYANFNLTVLDVCPVTIGDNVFVGPNVSLLTPKHPLCFEDRNPYLSDKGYYTDKEYGAPITIGSNVWIAGNVTVLAGAEIGDGCVIGAGSVVVKDIPSYSVAVGNPCKVIKTLK